MLNLLGATMALAEGEKKAAKRRAKIDARSSNILDHVLGESELAKELYGKAMGYAIFETTEAALGVSGGVRLCFHEHLPSIHGYPGNH
jgi:hypothetical protein